MDYFERAFQMAKEEKLNFDGFVEMFGTCADVENVIDALLKLYFDYTRVLFLLDDRDSMPLSSDIENELYWMRCTIETFQKMREPNGKVKIEM